MSYSKRTNETDREYLNRLLLSKDSPSHLIAAATSLVNTGANRVNWTSKLYWGVYYCIVFLVIETVVGELLRDVNASTFSQHHLRLINWFLGFVLANVTKPIGDEIASQWWSSSSSENASALKKGDKQVSTSVNTDDSRAVNSKGSKKKQKQKKIQ